MMDDPLSKIKTEKFHSCKKGKFKILPRQNLLLAKRVKTFQLHFPCYISENEDEHFPRLKVKYSIQA
jgi:hypothetical protein